MSWIEVRARFSPPPEDWSIVAEAFRTHGIENTLESGEELVGAIVDVDSATQPLELLQHELERLGAAEVRVGELEEVNWQEAWKQFFHPRRVGGRFIVRPTWEEIATGPDDLVIVLDPGQAFGTGDHPTTRMCLELLENAAIQGKRIADIGCGSGILSIGAKLLGASEVEAIDIDPIAVEVAQSNARLNNVAFACSVGNGFEDLAPSSRDAVVSNIISAVLIRVAPDAARVLVAGGNWILSGIISENWPDVLEATEKAGFTLRRKVEEDGWVGALLQKDR